MRLPIHPDGWLYIGLFFAANLLLFLISSWAGWLFVPLTLWCVAFFRDPDRRAPEGDRLILSPADGRLLPIVETAPPAELGLGPTPRRRLSIFMNVFNVHVNRNPIGGAVIARSYRKGRFFNASFDKASEHNERMSLRIRNEQWGDESDLAVVQIAGLVARRIRCDLTEGQRVYRGERFGIIRFGSRLDVYLPPSAKVLIEPGRFVRAGETVLAEIP